MSVSSLISVVGCCFLAGCGVPVQPGLANAPWLGGTSPETRVHDAVANGHDACERSMFPQGEVLRGQVPPCSKETPRAWAQSLRAEPASRFRFCPAPLPPHAFGSENGLAAFPLPPQRVWLACDPPKSASPASAAPPPS